MNIFNMISKFFDTKKYRKNPVPQNLSAEQFTAINIGAINSEQIEYFCDSLSTGSSVTDIKVYFDLIKGALSDRETQIDRSGLDEDDIARMQEYISNLRESFGNLISYDFI